VEALRDIASAPNQKVFFLPVEATGILASLGGVAELARDAMQRQQSLPARPAGGAPTRPGGPPARPGGAP
jgi:hypothetical protein